LALKQLLGIGILLMWFGYFYLYLFIGGEVIRKRRKKSKTFFYQPNHTLSKDRTQFSLVLFGERHRCFDVIMPLCNYSGICD
jgi:hypothetical protein